MTIGEMKRLSLKRTEADCPHSFRLYIARLSIKNRKTYEGDDVYVKTRTYWAPTSEFSQGIVWTLQKTLACERPNYNCEGRTTIKSGAEVLIDHEIEISETP